MNLSEDYLYEQFKKSYSRALAAKDGGDSASAKENLLRAADYLDKLSVVSAGEYKEKHAARAKRVRALAELCESNSTVPPRSCGNVAAGHAEFYPRRTVEECDLSPDTQDADAAQFLTLIRREDLKFGFEGVIGLESAKRAVTEYVINPVRYPEAYNYDFLDSSAILLEGPPGTGKTTFAKAVAKEAGLPFALINVAALVNCYVGETGKNIDKVFAYLRDYAGARDTSIIVFFDEFDEIAKKRGGDDKASEASVPALLRNLDGVKSNKGFLILANTNCRDMLDGAIVERFRRIIRIPLPDEQTRFKLYEQKLTGVEERFKTAVDLNAVSRLSDGLSGRDITFICDDFKRELAKIKAGLLHTDDVGAILAELTKERKASKNL